MDGQRQDTQNGVSMERELTAGEKFALQKEKAGGFKQLQTQIKKTSWFVHVFHAGQLRRNKKMENDTKTTIRKQSLENRQKAVLEGSGVRMHRFGPF